MKVSFTLCTKNGGERLATCLAHIDALDAPDDMELFLIDNGSDDGVSYQRVQDFAATSRFDAKVRQTFVPGNSAGRNLAIAEATGDIHIFIDDDCYPDAELVRSWMRAFEENAEVGFASGRVLRHNSEHSLIGCVEHREVRYMPPRKFIWRGFMQGSNMAFRSACLRDIGMFDPRFGAGMLAGEDWDMGLRGSAAGWAGYYSPTATVSHDHRRHDADILPRVLYYDYGGGMIYAKNTFGRTGLRIAREFIRELGKLRPEPQRRDALKRGYLDFLRRAFPVA